MTDKKLIEKAREFATKAHEGQLRKDDKTPYITHPIGVAKLVETIDGSTEQIVIALLHDVIEDCDGYDYALIEKEFGSKIADGVQWLTDISKEDRPELNRAARKAVNNTRLAHAPMDIKEVKLCDIYYNVHDLNGMKEGFRKRFLNEKMVAIEDIFLIHTPEDFSEKVVDMITRVAEKAHQELKG